MSERQAYKPPQVEKAINTFKWITQTPMGRRRAVATISGGAILVASGIKIGRDRYEGVVYDQETARILTENHFLRIDTLPHQMAIPPWGKSIELNKEFGQLTKGESMDVPIVSTELENLQPGWNEVLLPFAKPNDIRHAAFPSDVNDWEVYTRTVNGPARISIAQNRKEAMKTLNFIGLYPQQDISEITTHPSFDGTAPPIEPSEDFRAYIVLIHKPPLL